MPHRLLVAAAAGLGLAAVAALPTTVLAQDETTMGEVVVRGAPYNPDVETRSRLVRFADLDLSRMDGARTLMHRIRAAARDVCSPEPSRTTDFAEMSDYRQCMIEAMDGAVAQAGSPLLDELYGRPREVAALEPY